MRTLLVRRRKRRIYKALIERDNHAARGKTYEERVAQFLRAKTPIEVFHDLCIELRELKDRVTAAQDYVYQYYRTEVHKWLKTLEWVELNGVLHLLYYNKNVTGYDEDRRQVLCVLKCDRIMSGRTAWIHVNPFPDETLPKCKDCIEIRNEEIERGVEP